MVCCDYIETVVFLSSWSFLHGFLSKQISGLGCRDPSASGLIWKGSILGWMPWAGVESRAEQCSQAGWLCPVLSAEEGAFVLLQGLRATEVSDGSGSEQGWQSTLQTPVKGHQENATMACGTQMFQLPSHIAVCRELLQCQQRSSISNVQILLGKLWD